jgi:hypothetical protein
LRQAYDYWQNQPGNYPKPESRSPRQTPRRERVYQARRRRSDPDRCSIKAKGNNSAERPIQLPPLSSPKAGPQRAMTDVSAATISVTYSPQEEKIHALSRVRRGNSAELSPKIWWIFGIASNPQSPKVPVKINRQDFSSRSKHRCNN